MKEDANSYQAPSVQLLEVSVETGFAGSSPNEIEVPGMGEQDQAGATFGWD